ncbi:unnamed protein product [Plasmodium vivax]|uniref:(malaria parasite P. vivax) hypothetical protein n=1 Tax=Plasmodium vivax TaxID=5855 RepID=A0A8S4H7T6_PLAVI|nr:unnamed protein product [Plasmodium vivax]
MSALSERKKGKNSFLFIHGVYNTAGGEQRMGQDPQKCEDDSPPCQTKGTIYERLCLGSRYLEMVLQECQTEEGKIDLRFACGDGCVYSAGDLLEEVGVFFLSNKRERVVLSFWQRGDGEGEGEGEGGDGEGDNDGDSDGEGCDDGDSDGEGCDDGDSDGRHTTHLLDVYIYLYLRRELKHAEGDGNYRALYFLNGRERLLNLRKYQMDVDHFAVRSWVFNNMSLLLPSSVVHSGGGSPDERENAGNTLTPFCKPPQRKNNPLLSLSQQHHMSLFRLNSMQNDQVVTLSSKICLMRKFPNILMTTTQGDYQLWDSQERDSLLPSESSHRRTNARRYHMKWEGGHDSGGTLHSVETHDGNLNSGGKFIGSKNLRLTEYVVDVPRQYKLVSSPFTFLNKKLVHLCQEGGGLKGKCPQGVDTSKTYYVIRMGRDGLMEQSVQSCLDHLPDRFTAEGGPSWVCILTQDLHIGDVFEVIRLNFCTPGGGLNPAL